MPLVALLLALTINTVSPQIVKTPDDIITVSATLLKTSNTVQYLQAAITKKGENKYFGYTRNLGGEWYQYARKDKLTDEDKVVFYDFTPVVSSWSGELQVKIDLESPNYAGPGDYELKLIRYLTSSGIDSTNSASLRINIPLTAVTVVTTEAEAEPEIEWSVPEKVILGEVFKLNAKLKNFEADKNYYLKVRAGLKDDQLTKAQTLNEDVYLSDGAAWADFPGITVDGSGSWSGDISAILPVGRDEGKYRIKIRWREQDAGVPDDSDIKEMVVVKPEIAAVPVVATTSAKIASPEAKNIVLATLSGQVLSSATESSFPEVVKEVKATKKPINKMPVVLGLLGLLCLGMSVWGIIRKRLKRR